MEFLIPIGDFFAATVPIWSAVIGAVTAVIGIRVTARLDAHQKRRAALAENIANFIEKSADAFAAFSRKEAPGTLQAKAAVASTRIVLSLAPSERAIQTITATTVNSVGTAEGGHALSAAQGALQDWYRGELSAEAALRQFEKERTEAAGAE